MQYHLDVSGKKDVWLFPATERRQRNLLKFKERLRSIEIGPVVAIAPTWTWGWANLPISLCKIQHNFINFVFQNIKFHIKMPILWFDGLDCIWLDCIALDCIKYCFSYSKWALYQIQWNPIKSNSFQCNPICMWKQQNRLNSQVYKGNSFNSTEKTPNSRFAHPLLSNKNGAYWSV